MRRIREAIIPVAKRDRREPQASNLPNRASRLLLSLGRVENELASFRRGASWSILPARVIFRHIPSPRQGSTLPRESEVRRASTGKVFLIVIFRKILKIDSAF